MAVPWTLKFEVAFDTNPGTEPGALDWTDLSSRLVVPTVDVTYGSGRLGGSGRGTCSVTLDNDDRSIDPTNPSVALNLVPMRHARLQATVSSVDYPLFRGYVDAWTPEWSPTYSTVTAKMVDAFAWLALQDADVDLDAQMSDERVTAILDLAGWPAGRRDIGAGRVEVEALEQDGANLLRVLLDTVDAEIGDLWVAPDGDITFRGRHARLNSSVAFTFDDTNMAVAPRPQWDTSMLTNIGRVELANGDAYEVTDSTSVTTYGKRVMSIRDLSLRAAEAEAVAQWEVVRFAEPQYWVDDLKVHSDTAGAIASVLGLRPGDLGRVMHQPPSGGQFDENLTIERIRHRVTPTQWTTHFDLSPYFGEGPWLTLDDATLGQLGNNKLAP